MFHVIEKYRTASQVILGVIGLSFVGFGMAAFQTGSRDNYIVLIGQEAVTREGLENAIRNIEASGGKADRQEVFHSLVEQAYLMEGAKKLGITVSEEQIKQMITDEPGFHDASGKFDPALFRTFLENNRISESDWVQTERRRQTMIAMLDMLGTNVTADQQALQVLNATMSPRIVRTSAVYPQHFAGQVKADDAAIRRYYDDNPARYTVEQGVQFEYFILSPKELAAKQSISEEEIAQALNEMQAAAKPKRRISHILIEVPEGSSDAERAQAKAQAEKIATEAQANPQKFAALAAQYSQDTASSSKGGDLGEYAQDNNTAMKPLIDTAFALEQGAVSDAVQSSFGYHIIQVTDIAKVDLGVQKEGIRTTLQEKKAQQAYSLLREAAEDEAFNHPDQLQSAAAKAGTTLQRQEQWLTRSNAGSLNIPDAVAEALFSDEVFKKKHNSEAVNVNGQSWFVRAIETRESALAPFTDVEKQVRNDYILAESLRLASEKAEQQLKQLQENGKADIAWSQEQEVAPIQARMLLPNDAYAVFMRTLPKDGKPAYAVLNLPDSLQLLEVHSVKNAANDPQALNAAKKQLATFNGNMLADAYIAGLRNTIKTRQGSQRISDEQ